MAKTNVVSDKRESSLARNGVKITYGQFSQTGLRNRTLLLLSDKYTNTPKPKTTISHTNRENVAGLTHSGSANPQKSFSIPIPSQFY